MEGPAPGLHSWEVPPEAAGEGLDRHVAERLGVARNQVRHWADAGRLRVAGRTAKASRALGPGQRVECDVPVPADDRVEPEAGDLVLLHEDADLLVLDKPPGLTVHPGAGRATGTLVHRLLHRFPELAGVGGPGRPGIVHRLDKDTSGVMVVARTPSAYRFLSRAFAGREVDKRYLAIVWGRPAEEGRMDAPVGRHPRERQRMTVRPDGRPAVTLWWRRGEADATTLLELSLETGRTHQIRVHLKHLHHPLVGDPLYGETRWKALPGHRQPVLRDFPRPALHAWRLSFAHPSRQVPVSFEARLPQDLRDLWSRLGGRDVDELLAKRGTGSIEG